MDKTFIHHEYFHKESNTFKKNMKHPRYIHTGKCDDGRKNAVRSLRSDSKQG